jgi:hypothetical protein
MNENIFKLRQGQYSVFLVEANTGIVLSQDGSYYCGRGKQYEIFDSLSEAEAFAKLQVFARPGIECSIRDQNGDHIKFVRK